MDIDSYAHIFNHIAGETLLKDSTCSPLEYRTMELDGKRVLSLGTTAYEIAPTLIGMCETALFKKFYFLWIDAGYRVTWKPHD